MRVCVRAQIDILEGTCIYDVRENFYLRPKYRFKSCCLPRVVITTISVDYICINDGGEGVDRGGGIKVEIKNPCTIRYHRRPS